MLLSNLFIYQYHDVPPSILAVYSGERWTGFGRIPSSAA
jgi:hypothetical protein